MDESRQHLLAEIERLKQELARERRERYIIDEVRAELAREAEAKERETADRARLAQIHRLISD